MTYHFRVSARTASARLTALDQTFTTTALVPDLAIALSHTGNFTQGDPAIPTRSLSRNVGAAASSGTVTVTDAPPSGLTITSMSGTGWSYNSSASTCTRSDASGGGYELPGHYCYRKRFQPALRNSVTNWPRFSGGGESNTANNSASDRRPLTVLAVASATRGFWRVGM